MDGERQRSGNRRRRRRGRGEQAPSEPILIAARRPIAPEARPAPAAVLIPAAALERAAPAVADPPRPEPEPPAETPSHRGARIVSIPRPGGDERERERQRLLARVLASDGRGAISRAVDAYRAGNFEFPQEQEVQLQLLEHFDEQVERDAILALRRIFDKQPPIKRPILEQRLRRLEEYADEAPTRDAAASLRRSLRT